MYENPSYPFAPTVWMTVAVTRGSEATAARKRRMPITALSRLAASQTAPSRTTLSAMMTLPGRDSRSAHPRYSAVFGLSASMNVEIEGSGLLARELRQHVQRAAKA